MKLGRWQTLMLASFLMGESLGVGVQNLRIGELVKASDVIVVADVSEPKPGHAQPASFRGQLLQSRAYSAELAVIRVLKGSIPKRVTVQYQLPVSFVGYEGLHRGTRMVFLRREGSVYGLADPYYPDFPAIAEPPSSQPSAGGNDVAATVVHEMRL
jgi:hypothetical protein